MPILYQQEVIRKPGKFTKPEIQKLAFLAYDENRETKNVKKWCKLGKASYQEMVEDMNKFLDGAEAITSLHQFPEDMQPCLKYAIENRDSFSTKAFLKQTNFNKLKNEIKILEDGNLNPKSSITNLMDRCADTALAIHKAKNFKNKSFDPKHAFGVMNLLKDSFIVGKEKFAKINGKEYLNRPFILNVPCILEIDPCIGLTPLEKKDKRKDTNEKEKDCPCKQLKAKEKDCNCDKTTNDPCECKCDDTCYDQNPCCAKKIELYVADLFVVKDEISCYKPGEIALIENVMMGEQRTKKHRHLQREETYTETEEENNTFNERDTQIDERFSLHKEIDKVIDTDLSVDAGVSYKSRAGNKKTFKTFAASLDVSYNQSKKDAKKIVQDQAKDVMTRAIERVEKKVRTLTSRRMINEIEEKNKHVFDGSGYSKHENGIYFHVNKEHKAQVFNYGSHTMFDIFIPDPSKRLKTLLEKKFKLEKPEKPCIIIENINPSDYLKYIQCYEFFDLEKPPETPPIKWDEYTFIEEPKDQNWDATHQITIDPGYTATQISFESLSITPQLNNEHHRLKINFGGGEILKEVAGLINGTNKYVSTDSINATGTSKLIISTLGMKRFDIKIKIKLEPDPVDTTPWKLDVFNRIMDKYRKELEDYNIAFEEFNRNKLNKFSQNTFMLSETIKEQLKHSALEYITCQFFDEKNGMRNNVKPCGLPQMDIRETEEFGEKVRFWEHAVNWKFMSYMLYSYYWSDKCTWGDKLQEEAPNGLFQKFLQAGYARISLAIRPGFESHIEYFLEEGEIWGGVGLPSYGDPDFLPIHQEIKESKDNFNADRAGYLIWDSSLGLQKDEIVVRNDRDTVEYFDIASPTTLDPMKVEADINRVVVIDCIEYRIVSINLVGREVVLKLDRDLEHKDPTSCPDDFDKRYKDRNKLWSTGAKFEGAPWAFMLPTSLTWLKEDECLPCYPINCKEKC